MQLLQFIILLSPVFGAVFKEEVCRSNFVDIRNDPSSISALPINYKTCTVLEGSFGKLQKSNEIFEINSGINILMDMMHMSNWTQIDDPFPVFENLVEITGHLRIYKTIKLMTLRNIFPNLRVIRGRDLILNYAFAVYRNTDLKDISLPNLRAIYGGVRIAENEKLCYVESIDFKDLVRSDGDILIESNHGTIITIIIFYIKLIQTNVRTRSAKSTMKRNVFRDLERVTTIANFQLVGMRQTVKFVSCVWCFSFLRRPSL